MADKVTIETGWTPVMVGEGYYITTTLGANTSWAAAVQESSPVTPAIPASTKLSGSKILVFVEITAQSSAGDPASTVVDVFMEMSPDGVNWTTHEDSGQNYIEVTDSMAHYGAAAVGWNIYIVDLQQFRSPYYRIGFNSQGVKMGTDLRFKMGYSYAK